MLVADFDIRVDALSKYGKQCGSCARNEEDIDVLIASCRVPSKLICNKCVEEFHFAFRVQSRFDELACGTDCDFCDAPSEVAVSLIRKEGISICDSCLNICRNIVDPKFQAKRNKKPELPSYCKLLRIEWENRFKIHEPKGSLLFTRLSGKQFSRIVSIRRIPRRWRKKFTDAELNNRLELLEKLTYSTANQIQQEGIVKS